MYNTILCAIEAQDEGKIVLEKACALATHSQAKLLVVSIVPYVLLPKDYQAQLEQEIIPKMEAMTSEMGIDRKDVIIKFGKPYQEVCEIAEAKEADLIVVGSHSTKGLNKLLGSTASAIANHAKVDVHLVKI